MSGEPQVWIIGGEKPVLARHIADWSSDIAGRESELEAAYAAQLGRSDENVERQVRIPGVGIADIVTDDAVIEVKLWLTRSALFSAVGQVTVYAAALSKPRRVVFGYDAGTPQTLIDAIRATGVEVVEWTAVGGPDWTDYTQDADYEGPEDDGDTEDWGEDE